MLMVMAASVVRRRRYSTRPDAGALRRRVELLRLHEEVSVTVLGPAGLVVVGADRPLLAVRDDAHAALRHTLADQIVHRRLGPALAERDVVLVGAPFVTVALDEQEHAGVALEPGRVGVERPGVGGPDLVLVEVEIDVVQLGHRSERAGLRPRGRRGRPAHATTTRAAAAARRGRTSHGGRSH